MRRYDDPGGWHCLLVQQKVISNKVYQNIKQGIGTTTGEIAEGALINPSGKRRMEEIYTIQNDISRCVQQTI